MKKFVAVLMSVSLGAVICLSNTGCPKTPDKDKPPPPAIKDSVPRDKISPPKDMPAGTKDKTITDKEIPGTEKDKAPAPKDKIEPAKDKKEKNGASLSRDGLPLTVADMLWRPDIGVATAFSRTRRC